MERTDSVQWKAREVARLLALVETERRYYQEIVASVPVGLLVLAADLSVVSSNREARKIFDLRSGALLPAAVLDRVREVLHTGRPQRHVTVTTQGEPARDLRIAIQSIRKWDDETEQEALVTIEEVGELPLPEPAVSGAAEPPGNPARPASELLEKLDAVVWVAELPSMKFLYVNDKARELLGYPAAKWLESPEFWRERIHPEDRDWVVQSYDRAIESWSRHSCEYRAQTSYGQVIWLRENARLLVDERGETRRLIGTAVEVTQRRFLDDQAIRAQRAEALGRFGNRVGHEIHNLLMVVSGYGEELLHGLPASHPLHPDLQEIVSATDRLRGLANQLSLFGRRPVSQVSPVDLSGFLGKLQPGLKNILGEGIRLHIKMFPATIGVQADPAQLEQLLLALGRRARREMNAGGTLTIECSPLEITENPGRDRAALRPGMYASMAIEDNGATPDAEARAAMFESAGAADGGREGRDDDGPILARVYGLVRQWGGDVAVAANSPRGVIFQVILPRVGDSVEPVRAEAAPEEFADAQRARTAAVVEPEPTRESILIVEEDEGIRALVKKILKRQNYIVLEAATADEARKAAQEHYGRLNLVIADVTATHFDGGRVAHEIAAHSPETRVLYISGYANDPAAQAADVPEGEAFLRKPFTLGSLLIKVREMLGTKPAPG